MKVIWLLLLCTVGGKCPNSAFYKFNIERFFEVVTFEKQTDELQNEIYFYHVLPYIREINFHQNTSKIWLTILPYNRIVYEILLLLL